MSEQRKQAFIRRVVGISLMALGVVIIIWGSSQYFRGNHGAGIVVITFGLLGLVAGYAVYRQA